MWKALLMMPTVLHPPQLNVGPLCQGDLQAEVSAAIWFCHSWLSKGRMPESLLQEQGKWEQLERWDRAVPRVEQRQRKGCRLCNHADLLQVTCVGALISNLISICLLYPSSLKKDIHALLEELLWAWNMKANHPLSVLRAANAQSVTVSVEKQ